ncbi:MAG TPA: hypothetical protein VMT16_16625 [Thermoanaerobaculia bacterium]|nr:hypothetical protein [Thermoanaerobaculia bacterium]
MSGPARFLTLEEQRRAEAHPGPTLRDVIEGRAGEVDELRLELVMARCELMLERGPLRQAEGAVASLRAAGARELGRRDRQRAAGKGRGRKVSAEAANRGEVLRRVVSWALGCPGSPRDSSTRAERANWILARIAEEGTAGPRVRAWATFARVHRFLRDHRL